MNYQCGRGRVGGSMNFGKLLKGNKNCITRLESSAGGSKQVSTGEIEEDLSIRKTERHEVGVTGRS